MRVESPSDYRDQKDVAARVFVPIPRHIAVCRTLLLARILVIAFSVLALEARFKLYVTMAIGGLPALIVAGTVQDGDPKLVGALHFYQWVCS